MTDDEIADALVTAGIGSFRYDTGKYYSPGSAVDRRSYVDFMTVEQFINDWRTAGACLERMDDCEIDENIMTDELRLPRAICEAFVRAQSTQDKD